MEKIDEGLKALLEQGKEKGYLTFTQVNDYLPDDAVNPEKLDQLILMLEEQGIELIDEEDVADREGSPAGAAAEADAAADLDLSFIDEDDGRRIDDPVRMYLTQMGEIPLLTREQEISLAKKIEITRKRFRRELLESDYIMKAAMDILSRVHKAELPFDRTIKVSMTEGLEKVQITGRMPHNLKTLEELRKQNIAAFSTLMSKESTASDREEVEQALVIRRRKMVTLLEELSLRTQRLQPAIKRLEQISERMTELEQRIDELRHLKSARDERANLQRELFDLMNLTLETPTSLRRRMESVQSRLDRKSVV